MHMVQQAMDMVTGADDCGEADEEHYNSVHLSQATQAGGVKNDASKDPVEQLTIASLCVRIGSIRQA